MADSSLIKKLLIKPGHKIAILNAPAGYLEQLGSLPEGVEIVDNPDGNLDMVQLFVKNKEEVDRLAPSAISAVKHDGLLWMCYPKGSSKIKTDISRDVGWESVRNAGFVTVSMISIDDTWSAMRFRPLDLVGKK